MHAGTVPWADARWCVCVCFPKRRAYFQVHNFCFDFWCISGVCSSQCLDESAQVVYSNQTSAAPPWHHAYSWLLIWAARIYKDRIYDVARWVESGWNTCVLYNYLWEHKITGYETMLVLWGPCRWPKRQLPGSIGILLSAHPLLYGCLCLCLCLRYKYVFSDETTFWSYCCIVCIFVSQVCLLAGACEHWKCISVCFAIVLKQITPRPTLVARRVPSACCCCTFAFSQSNCKLPVLHMPAKMLPRKLSVLHMLANCLRPVKMLPRSIYPMPHIFDFKRWYCWIWWRLKCWIIT